VARFKLAVPRSCLPLRRASVLRTPRIDRNLRWWTCLCLCVIFSHPLFASSRDKDDVVYMDNGDVITCEIRSLEQGQLTVKQDYSNATAVFDWKKVGHIVSRQPFVVINTKGKAFSGTLSEDPQTHIVIVTGSTIDEVPHNDVVSIEETGETFLRKLHGDVDLGLDFAQSNAQQNLTLQGDLTYQATQNLFSLTDSTTFTSQQETKNTRETNVKAEYFTQLRRSDLYGGGIANFLSSSEQQINLRTTLGGALAIRPLYTNKTVLSFIGGFGYTFETDATDTTSTASKHSIDSAEAVQFSTFRFDSTTFDTTAWVYPSLTSPGRVRLTLNQDIYYKFYKDFYIRASFYDNYDNRPVVGAPANNLGVSSTVGWSFR